MNYFSSSLIFGAVFLCCATTVSATPQTFRSNALKGSMDEFYRITVTRDCTGRQDQSNIKCTKQAISVGDKTGTVNGRFDGNEIPVNQDGSHKVNLAAVYTIDEDSAGEGMRYFLLRFVPQDTNDMTILPNGQMYPKYYEVITDAELKPLKGMRLSANGAAQTWIEVKRKKYEEKIRKYPQEKEFSSFKIDTYLQVMEER